ncbi:MAG: RNA polymerase sigma factor [Oscillospiraceae bacterium]|nr:RNA polymerase sigma factor [Oscillospiraceae bacterium]
MDIENNDDREKVMRLYEKYKNLMYKEAYQILHDQLLAEDAIHDSFVKVIRNLHKINENNIPQTRSYLVIICRNTAIDMVKAKLPLNQYDYATEYVSSDDSETVSDSLDIVIKRETINDIVEAIEALPPIYRDVFILRRVHNYKREEIAKLLNINVETVKKRLTRAKHMLIRSLNRRDKYE